MCKHTGAVGFCGQCDGQWVVRASGTTYVFDLDAGTVTILPADGDDGDGVLPYPQLLMLTQDLGSVSVKSPMEVAARDHWGGARQITGWISHISRF